MLSKDVEETLISIGMETKINELNQYLHEYDKRCINIIESQKVQPKRLLGQNGLHYLQLALHRSRALMNGSIDSILISNPLVGFLSTRAHFEVTGGIAYFYKKLNTLYKGIITYDQINDLLHTLIMGARIDELVNANAPAPINVMCFIDAADEYYKDKGIVNNNKISMFKEFYGFLSEYCHPNYYGLGMGCNINNVGTVKYNDLSTLNKDNLVFLNDLLLSCEALFNFYDMTYDLLASNEELPIIVA